MADNWWEGRKVMVTGGSGFLGEWIRRRLDPAAVWLGADINPAPGDRELDVEDYDAVADFLHDYQPDVVIHLAGVSHINEAQASAGRAFGVNTIGTVNVMGALASQKATSQKARLYQPHVVIASSNHVYGSHQGMSKRTEDSPLHQMDVYGASKHCADVAGRSIGLNAHIPTVALRHVNAYGPYGHPSHITQAAIAAGIEGKPLQLRGDGTARKEYLYASDVADAYLFAAKHATDIGVNGRAFNVSPNAEPPSVLDWVKQVNLVLENKGYTPQAPLPGGKEQSGYYEALDSSEFRKWTGWWPRYSPSQGILETLQWMTAADA